MSIVSKLSFSRCSDPDGDILDDCWCAKHANVALHSDYLASFFDNAMDSTVEIYLAGKSTGPNQLVLETVNDAFNEICCHLPKLDCLPNPELNFTTIWVPYQTVKMFYVRFWSDYGSELEYGIKLDNCSFGPRGLMYPSNTEDPSVGSVPGTVNYVLNELTTNLAGGDSELADVHDRIQADDIMGVEILSPLLNIVRRNRELLTLADHYQALLGYVQRHAIDA
jgi:hypothetical protein